MTDPQKQIQWHLDEALRHSRWHASVNGEEHYRVLGQLPWVLWVREVDGGWVARLENRYSGEKLVWPGVHANRDDILHAAVEWATGLAIGP